MSPRSRSVCPSTRVPELVSSLLLGGLDVRIRLSGFSMKPLVRSGSVLRFSAMAEPTTGDIVLLHYPGQKLVAHRVLRLSDESVWTKGDSCRAPDPPAARAQVLGAATCLEVGPVAIRLQNKTMRSLGRLASVVYPKLVLAFRAVFPTKLRKDELSCAS